MRALILRPAPQGEPIGQALDRSVLLHARDATIHGTKLQYEKNPQKHLGYWVNVTDRVCWDFTVALAGRFDVEIHQGCGTGHGGSTVAYEARGAETGVHRERHRPFPEFRAAKNLAPSVWAQGRHRFWLKPIRKGHGRDHGRPPNPADPHRVTITDHGGNQHNSIHEPVRNVVDSIKGVRRAAGGVAGLLHQPRADPLRHVYHQPLILIFGRQIINHLSVTRSAGPPSRLRLLRLINAALFLTYFFAVAFQFQLGSNISHPGLLVLLMYLTWQFTHALILKKYGRKREVEGTAIYVESYTSNNLRLIALLLLGIVAGLIFLTSGSSKAGCRRPVSSGRSPCWSSRRRITG
ncbi:MAG: hypothetical protein CM1200mP34_5150 [Verrucomicrobiales bacterium]|nr:MAG: hypothetical protein CM1200mP34_5150 [Verrucomicrobiales bacterium]